MIISYNKLWKLLIDRKMSNTDLRRVSGICPNTLTKLRRDQEVSMPVLERICSALNVDIGDIMEFSDLRECVNSEKVWSKTNEKG